LKYVRNIALPHDTIDYVDSGSGLLLYGHSALLQLPPQLSYLELDLNLICCVHINISYEKVRLSWILDHLQPRRIVLRGWDSFMFYDGLHLFLTALRIRRRKDPEERTLRGKDLVLIYNIEKDPVDDPWAKWRTEDDPERKTETSSSAEEVSPTAESTLSDSESAHVGQSPWC
jgi:hypothetical protein